MLERCAIALIIAVSLACTDGRRQTVPPSSALTPTTAASRETVSECGQYSLRLHGVTPSNAHDMKTSWVFDFAAHAPEVSLSDASHAFYLDKVSVRRVVTSDGNDRSIADPSEWSDNYPPSITVNFLVGYPAPRELTEMDLEVTVVKVTKWQSLKFEGLGQVQSGYLKCGPFDLVTNGEADAFHVLAAAFGGPEHDYAAFDRKVPLSFLHHVYAANNAAVTDGAGHSLFRTSIFSTGGASAATYILGGELHAVVPDKIAATMPSNAVTLVQDKILPIAYPVTLTMPIPETFTQETVVFRVKNLPIP